MTIPAIAVACIDIGSNTTRLLVAEADGEGLRELATERVFTRIGRSLSESGRIPPEKLAEVAAVVARQARRAVELGAGQVEIVATAAIRKAENAPELVGAVSAETGIELRVLSGREEARLAFAGATKMLGAPVEGELAVIDVGGGSTEIAIGTADSGVSWCESFPLGSGLLANSHLRSDPPGLDELEALQIHARAIFEGVTAPPARSAVAVGGSATSLRRLVGATLEPEAFERALTLLSETPAAEVAQRFELDPERVRLLPAGLTILEQVAGLLGLSLSIGRGGLREGIVLDLLAGESTAARAVAERRGPVPPTS